LVLSDTCRIRSEFIDESKFPKNSYFRKLKSFKVDIRESFKKGAPEKYPDHHGYGDENFTPHHNIQPIFWLPNFEKFKSLEQLDLYNYFREDKESGILFSMFENSDYIKLINKFCRNSKVKNIWIHGYRYKQVEELKGSIFQEVALALTEGTNIKINGMNRSSLEI
jgi:hypothetical protein